MSVTFGVYTITMNGKMKRVKGKSSMENLAVILSFSFFLFPSSFPVFASSGTEGAAFLDIPVGGRPAAMGAAYSAMSNDAYAPTYNPGGLGFLDSKQFSGQHLSYIDTLHYEYLSFAVP